MDDKANRGKSSEKKVEAFLKKCNGRSDFCFHRFPDARSARGALARQPSDFLAVSKGVSLFIEVKHTNHASLLPKDKLSQHAILNKFAHAGATCLAVIEHEGVGWRVVNVVYLPFGVPSWDLSGYEVYPNAEEALLSTGVF